MPDTYRGWTIHYDPPPIPIRSFDWQAYGPNYDASYEGEEDGWVDNGEKATARTRDELIEEIDAWFEENCDSDAAATAALCEDIAVPQDRQARARSASPKNAQNTPSIG